MNGWLLAIVTAIYALVGLNMAISKNYPLALVWAGYALANIGLILDMGARA